MPSGVERRRRVRSFEPGTTESLRLLGAADLPLGGATWPRGARLLKPRFDRTSGEPRVVEAEGARQGTCGCGWIPAGPLGEIRSKEGAPAGSGAQHLDSAVWAMTNAATMMAIALRETSSSGGGAPKLEKRMDEVTATQRRDS